MVNVTLQEGVWFALYNCFLHLLETDGPIWFNTNEKKGRKNVPLLASALCLIDRHERYLYPYLTLSKIAKKHILQMNKLLL